jgi:hypothetical protein
LKIIKNFYFGCSSCRVGCDIILKHNDKTGESGVVIYKLDVGILAVTQKKRPTQADIKTFGC